MKRAGEPALFLPWRLDWMVFMVIFLPVLKGEVYMLKATHSY